MGAVLPLKNNSPPVHSSSHHSETMAKVPYQGLVSMSIITLTCLLTLILKRHPFREGSSSTLRNAAEDVMTTFTLSKPPIRRKRLVHSILYWTPHKTGSTSMRYWLRHAAENANLRFTVNHTVYAKTQPNEWHMRHPRGRNCSIIAGHIRMKNVADRRHEGELGAVLTTTRDTKDTLVSRYFHTRMKNISAELEDLKDPDNERSFIWFFHFNDYDPCEPFRYYDGIEGCDLTSLKERAAAIANRIDCVVDTDDPEKDYAALCKLMRLPRSRCPETPTKNVRAAKEYADLFQYRHLTEIMERVSRVYDVLRDALLERRCRFLVDGTGRTMPGFEEPRWPGAGCREGRRR